MTDLRLAVVGLGGAGRQHLVAAGAVAGLRVTAVCDADAATARTVQLGMLDDPDQPPPAVAGLDTVLADPDIDAVSLCVPPGAQAGLAIAALQAGKAVVLEKPPALSEAELDTLLAAAELAQRPVVVMLQHRFRLPDEVWRHPPGDQAMANLEVVRRRPLSHYAARPWRLDPGQSGGGLFAHLGIHFADLACQLLGDVVDVAPVKVTELAPGIDASLAGVVSFSSGATLVMIATTTAEARSERLAVYDGSWAVTVTQDGCRWNDHGVESAFEPPLVSSLRSEVFKELREAATNGREPPRSNLARCRGVVRLLEGLRVQR